MPVYMTPFSYAQEATTALIKNPEDRAAVLEKMINEMGGKLITNSGRALGTCFTGSRH